MSAPDKHARCIAEAWAAYLAGQSFKAAFRKAWRAL